MERNRPINLDHYVDVLDGWRYNNDFFLAPEDINQAETYLQNQYSRLDTHMLKEVASRTILDQDSRLKPQIVLARQFLRQFFGDLPELQPLTKSGGGIVLYGSLQYNDPRNFDADILIVNPGQKAIRDFSSPQYLQIEREFISKWSRYGSEPHIDELMLKSAPSQLASLQKTEGGWFNNLSIHITKVVTGLPLWPIPTKWHNNCFTQAKQILESHPLAAALANVSIAETLDIRRQRQKQI